MARRRRHSLAGRPQWLAPRSGRFRRKPGPQGSSLRGHRHGGHPTRGIVWVGTTQGVARLAPSLWQTPPEVAHIRSAVQGTYEDPDGTLWFLSGTGLSRLRGEEWKE